MENTMKTIAVFGCSFTAGHGGTQRRWVNWPAELAIQTKDKHKIVSCARGGTSMEYSAFMLDYYLKNYPKPDLIIFQFTTLHRVSWIPNDEQKQYKDLFDYWKYFDFLENQGSDTKKYGRLKNLYRLYPKENSDFGFMTSGGSIQGTKKLARLYYGTTGFNIFENIRPAMVLSYIKELAGDIPLLTIIHTDAFYHDPNFIKNIDINCRDAIGADFFDANIIDDGRHISEKALSKFARVIYNTCKEREIL